MLILAARTHGGGAGESARIALHSSDLAQAVADDLAAWRKEKRARKAG